MWLKPWALVHLSTLAGLNAGHEQEETPSNSSIAWSDCPAEMKIKTPSQCGTLAVPLDYTDEDSKTLELPLIKVKATKEPFKGSILYNPGGPGIPGVASLAGEWPILMAFTGGHFDVIGFDARGTGNAIPISCYQDVLERLRMQLLSPVSTNASDTAIGTAWAIQKSFAESCYENAKDIGELMSTAFVARDMMKIVDALEEDGMLRYFGQSYGTLLGATVAAMFPERIDRIVLDGVINPHDYYEGWEYDPGPVGDLTLEKFLEQCVEAGRPACALAAPNATVKSLQSMIYGLVDQVKFEPIVMGSNITTELVGMTQVMEALNTPLRITINYGIALAGYFQAIFDRNVTAYHENRIALGMEASLTPTPIGDAAFGIRCSESTHRSETLNEDVRERVAKIAAQSPIFAEVFTSSYMACSAWKMKAKERFIDFSKKKTKNPMLIIGSPYDLRTPLVSAQNLSASFEDSVVLQHNGLGHCVMYSPGQCAIEKIKAYFEEGKLPEPGTICEQDYSVFSGKTVADSFGLGQK